MNWLHYLLEANIYLAVFYTGYCLFLSKETHYTLNRAYLLLSCVLSFMLPFMQIGILKPAIQSNEVVVFVTPSGTSPIADQAVNTPITLEDILNYAYLLGVTVLGLILLFKLFKLFFLVQKTKASPKNGYKIVYLENANTAFSFFNYMFIGPNTAGSEIIIRHELVHIRQKHTLDVLFLEFIKIISWFNPFVYFMQNSLKTVHEYIADEQTAAHETDALAYSSFLVNNAYGLNNSTLAHSFFNYNLLKKRIIMLNQKRSGNLARLKHLVAVPICAAALCASTLGFSKTYALIDLVPQKMLTDSTAKSKKQPTVYLPPPIMVKNGYDKIYNHLAKTAKYPKTELKNKQAGLVIAAFKIGTDHKISDIKIAKGSNADFNNEVLKSLQRFTGTIDDNAGEHKLAISFYTDFYNQSPNYKADIQNSGAEFNTFVIGGLGSMPVPPPPPGVKNLPSPVKRAAPIGKEKIPPPPPPAKPVSASKLSKLIPPPPPPRNPFDSLYKHIARVTRYPKSAYDNQIGGRVIMAVTINNGKIDDVKLTRPLYDEIDAEIVRAVKSYKGSLGVKSGYYSLPVSFSLLDGSDNQVAHTPENYTSTDNALVLKGDAPKVSLNEVSVVGYTSNKR